MKVLLPIIYHELTECIERAFQEEGHETLVVNWRKHGKEASKGRIEPEIIAEAKKFQPDLAFCQFQAPGLISVTLPSFLNSIGCFSINWAGDVRHPLPEWYMRLAPHFDVTSFSNFTDVDLIRAAGHRSEFLQIGYDERLYNTEGAGERSGVVFIGNNYSGYKFAESDSRRDMVKAMAKAFGKEFTVYGMSWEDVVPKENIGGYVREPADADILKRALVAVGMDHFFRPWFASDRLLRATACGCAVVQRHYDGVEVEHPHIVTDTTIEGMIKSVRSLLHDPERATTIGGLSAAHTKANHRWNDRVPIIMDWMK